MNDSMSKWIEKQYREKYLPAYQALMSVYPFGLEDLEGEVWADIEGYEGLYQVSNFGRIKSFMKYDEGRIRTPILQKTGYLRVILHKNGCGVGFVIHRLVAKTFVPNPDNLPEVNHIDGNKLDSYFENLEWTTSKENQQHAIKTGLMKTGAERSISKLDNAQVRYIRQVYKKSDKKYGTAALARKFNVSRTVVDYIVKNKTYKNID